MPRYRTIALLICSLFLVIGLACVGSDVELPKPYIIIFNPAPHQMFLTNYDNLEIRWGARHDVSSEVRIELFRDGLSGSAELLGTYPAYDYDFPNSLLLPTTGPASDNCVIKITDIANEQTFDASGTFKIIEPGLYIRNFYVFNLDAGKEAFIFWHAEAATQASIANIKIELTRDNGSTWEVLTSSTPAADGSHPWKITDGGLPVPQEQCMFRITDVDNPTNTDTSIQFTIDIE